MRHREKVTGDGMKAEVGAMYLQAEERQEFPAIPESRERRGRTLSDSLQRKGGPVNTLINCCCIKPFN